MAQEGDSTEVVHEDFQTLGAALRGSRELQLFVESPVVDDLVKERVLTQIFDGKVSDLVIRFVRLLARKGRSRDLPAIIDAFSRLRDVERNETPAMIRTAVDLRDDQKEAVLRHLSTMAHRTLRPQWIVDPTLIGGFTALIADTMVDASVRNQLERLRRSLIHGSLN